MELEFKIAQKSDAPRLLEIYAPYVEKTAITFECNVPDKAEFENRIENVLKKYPYIIAETNGEAVGYAYAGAFNEREAYDRSVEVTVYVKEKFRNEGIGKRLYEVLERILSMQNILNLNACIAYNEKEDEYLTKNSAQFHEHLGYKLVGEFHQCGYKFGRWYNMIWMEKHIGAHSLPPKPVRKFDEVRERLAEECGIA